MLVTVSEGYCDDYISKYMKHLFLNKFMYVCMLFIYFAAKAAASSLLQLPLPYPLCSHPQSTPSPFLLRKGQISHDYQQSMAYQATARQRTMDRLFFPSHQLTKYDTETYF